METFWETLAFVTGLMLVLGAPVLFVAWRAGLRTVARGFAVAAGVIGVFFATSAVASERLVDDCGKSGGIACLDIGYLGFLFFVATVYVIASALVAFNISRR